MMRIVEESLPVFRSERTEERLHSALGQGDHESENVLTYKRYMHRILITFRFRGQHALNGCARVSGVHIFKRCAVP